MPGRCPSCDAALPAGARWCSLCYADLRPRPAVPPPAPPPPPVAAVGASPAAGAVAILPPHPILDAPLEVLETAPGVLETAAGSPGVVVPDVIAPPTWPCGACGERVDLELSTCPTCGGRFLAAAGESAIVIPGLGRVGTLSTSAKVALMTGGTVVLIAVLVLLSFVLGSLL